MRGSDKESSASLAQVTHYDKVRRSADSFEIPFAYNVSVKRLRGSVALKRIIDRDPDHRGSDIQRLKHRTVKYGYLRINSALLQLRRSVTGSVST
eukprot:gene4359-20580_t